MALVPLLPGLQENKANLSRRTWWGLFAVSLGMAVFSGVLVGLMVVQSLSGIVLGQFEVREEPVAQRG